MRWLRRVLLVFGMLFALGGIHSLIAPRLPYRQCYAGAFFAQQSPWVFNVQYVTRDLRRSPPDHEFQWWAGLVMLSGEWDGTGVALVLVSYWFFWAAIFASPFVVHRLLHRRRRKHGFPMDGPAPAA